MTVYAITDTKKGRTGIAPTYLQTTQIVIRTESACRSGSSPKVNHFSRSSFAGQAAKFDRRPFAHSSVRPTLFTDWNTEWSHITYALLAELKMTSIIVLAGVCLSIIGSESADNNDDAE